MPIGAERPAVKICGITRPEDAARAVELGARYLGVIFAGGPRQVTIPVARSVVTAAGQVPVLGVFGSQEAGEILDIRNATGLTGAQLHVGADAARVETLSRAGLLVVVVTHLVGDDDLAQLEARRAWGCPLLVEPRVAGRPGGTGEALPLDLAVRARRRLAGHPMWLAGGLTPETVAEAVARVAPEVVDVSSGVEQIPGIKDHTRMARFLEAAGWT